MHPQPADQTSRCCEPEVQILLGKYSDAMPTAGWIQAIRGETASSTARSRLQVGSNCSGRYWDRTSDLLGVNEQKKSLIRPLTCGNDLLGYYRSYYELFDLPPSLRAELPQNRPHGEDVMPPGVSRSQVICLACSMPTALLGEPDSRVRPIGPFQSIYDHPLSARCWRTPTLESGSQRHCPTPGRPWRCWPPSDSTGPRRSAIAAAGFTRTAARRCSTS
jgi:hypothetical protein